MADSLYDMMDLIIFNITFTCTAVIAFNLLVVELNESINFEMLVAFADLVVVLLITALYFFHSEWITSDLYEIGDNFYNSPWYILPIRQQRLLVLPIQRAGREFRLKGLGIFECSLVLFLAVNSTISTHWVDPGPFKLSHIFNFGHFSIFGLLSIFTVDSIGIFVLPDDAKLSMSERA